jgi:hypothetical protein
MTPYSSGRTPFDGLGHTDGRTSLDGLGHTNGRTPFDGHGNAQGRTPFDGLGNAYGGGTPSDGFGNLGGPLPPLPFHNESETQDSYLGPSQETPGTGSFRLFYEPTAACGGQFACQSASIPAGPLDSASLQARHPSGPPAARPPAPSSTSASTRNIFLEFCVYV